MTTRKYTQQARAAAAEETRRRILDAMRRRLRGCPCRSPERRAHRSGCRRRPFDGVPGVRLKGGTLRGARPGPARTHGFPAHRRGDRAPRRRDAVRESLRAAASVYAAEREVARTIYSMWALEPEAVRRAFEVVEHGRIEGQRRMAGRLAQEGHLRLDVTVEEAIDILWVVRASRRSTSCTPGAA